MKRKTLTLHLAAVLLPVLVSTRALSAANSPMDQIRAAVEKVLTVLNDPNLKAEGRKAERRAQLKQIIYPKFDFQEMAKRSLGSQWQRRTPEEQREFTDVFTLLLEKAYVDQIESYNGEKVRYGRQNQEGNLAEVDTKIVNKKGEEFSVDYKLHLVEGDWKVYDVVIENISLVNNYRSQFSRVLAKSSFEELLRTMKEKKSLASGKKKS
jgi:phospholipid transport system substrate-binding protein